MSQDSEPPSRTDDVKVADDLTFTKYLLSDSLLSALKELNFEKPSPIQSRILPLVKCGLDMIVQSKSGTGKTLAFSFCLLEQFEKELKFPQSLIIVPTREIAVQIVGVLTDLGKHTKSFKARSFIGGTDVNLDRKNIQSCSVIVGTPGRIMHLIKSEIFNIFDLKTLVLDEADKLLENGKMKIEVLSIQKLLRKKVQIIATSATVTEELELTLKKMMKNPIGITPKREIPVLLGIKQFVRVLPREKDNIKLMLSKITELDRILSQLTFKQCLLFTDSQAKTDSYGNYLKKEGWKNEVINGSQDQETRLKVLQKLIDFKCRILITTDLLARGIDIDNINLIINLDLPFDCYTYLHRIGRAGRFGTHGIAITFVNGEEGLEKFQIMLGEIGGIDMKVFKLPEDSTIKDLWADDNTLFGSIGGLIDEEETIEIESNDKLKHKESVEKANLNVTDSKDDVLINNMALMQLSKLLINDNNEDQLAFDLHDMLNDYEMECLDRSSTKDPNSSDEKEKAEVDPEINAHVDKQIDIQIDTQVDPQIDFMKAIEELKLYSDEKMQEIVEKNEESSMIESDTSCSETKEENRMSSYSSLSSSPAPSSAPSAISSPSPSPSPSPAPSKISYSSISSQESKINKLKFLSLPTKKRRVQNMENIDNSKNIKSTIHEIPVQSSTYTQYQQYSADHYSQWSNIYNFQLANIQNYLQYSKK